MQCKTWEEMKLEYQKLYPEIFTGNYVFGTSNNMIQVMSKIQDVPNDEHLDINLPYYNATILKFEFRFHRFNPTNKSYDFDWKTKNIKYKDNNIYLHNSYATYFKDLEQTFYFDIVNSNLDYTGIQKIWSRGKKKLLYVIEYDNGNPIQVLTEDEYEKLHNDIELLEDNIII